MVYPKSCISYSSLLGPVSGVATRPLQGSSSPYKKPNLVATVTAVPMGGQRATPINSAVNAGLHDPGRLQVNHYLSFV